MGLPEKGEFEGCGQNRGSDHPCGLGPTDARPPASRGETEGGEDRQGGSGLSGWGEGGRGKARAADVAQR